MHAEYILTVRGKRMTGHNCKLVPNVIKVCFFRTDFDFLNHFLVQSNITRHQGDKISLYRVSETCIEQLLSGWTESKSTKNRIHNRPCPLPNVNGYCWPNPEINRLIYGDK